MRIANRGRFAPAYVLVGALVLFGGLLASMRAQFGAPVGPPLPGLTTQETNLFNKGKTNFTINWATNQGLGPVFTLRNCVGCHSSPIGGGSSIAKNTLFGTINSDGTFNYLFNEGGPLLQPLSVQTLLSRNGCVLPGEVLPADATVVSKRVVPALFGFGLIDSIPDEAILHNAVDQGDGIHGVPNMTFDSRGILRPGRFGFKAQRPTLLQLVADAFAHDLGITNPVVPDEDLPQGHPIPPACQGTSSVPNDSDGTKVLPIFHFVLFLAPTAPTPLTETAQAGQQTFLSIGCAKCHVPSMQTEASIFVPLDFSGRLEGPSAALSNQQVNLYSDLLLHDMGPGLADGFPLGQAGGSQWRTTPLWGVSQKSALLHDGSTSDLTVAIQRHGGEATTVIGRFNALSSTDRANLLEFLKSL